MKRLALLTALMLLASAIWWRHQQTGGENSRTSHRDSVGAIPSRPATTPEEPGFTNPTAASARTNEDIRNSSEVATVQTLASAKALVKTTPTLSELKAQASNSADDAREYATALTECTAALRRPFADSELSRGAFADYHALMNGTDLSLALLGSRREECQQLLEDVAPDQRWQSLVEQVRLAWNAAAAKGDAYARLWVLTRNWIEDRNSLAYAQAQDLSMQLLNIDDPSTLVRLAPRMRVFRQHPEAWTLAACDLGFDCSSTGPMVTRDCLLRGLCRSGDYVAELERDTPPMTWAEIQVQRARILDLIRGGNLRGLFDVPPTRP